MIQKLILLALVATAMAGGKDCGYVSDFEDSLCDYEGVLCAVYVEDLSQYPVEEDGTKGSCNEFCHTQGKACVGAHNDDGDECGDQDDLDADMCDEETSGDYVCECSEDPLEDECTEDFDDVELSCGSCTVLVENIDDYETCDEYCGEQDRVCKGAWEEVANTCVHDDDWDTDCETDFSKIGGTGTSDALCQCGEDGEEPEETVLETEEEEEEEDEECNDDCKDGWIDDGYCDDSCNNKWCDYDGEDCDEDDDVDCEGSWGDWGECEGSGNDWHQTRSYEVETEALGHGEECPKDQERECNEEPITSCYERCGLTHREVPEPQQQQCAPWDMACLYYQQMQMYYPQPQQQPWYPQQQWYPQQFTQGGQFWGQGQFAGAARPATAGQSPMFPGAQQSLFGVNPWQQATFTQPGAIGAPAGGIGMRFRNGQGNDDNQSDDNSQSEGRQAFTNVGGWFPQQPIPQPAAGTQPAQQFWGQQQQPFWGQQQPFWGQQQPFWGQQPYWPQPAYECSCDDYCSRYGDCCQDYQYYCYRPQYPQWPQPFWG